MNASREFHEYAEIFPMMGPEEIEDLAKRMHESGYDETEPIYTLDDKILDGRNRFTAAMMADVEPVFREYKGKDPLGFVVQRNINRRHLTESQRSMVATKIAKLRKEDGRPKNGLNLSTSQDDAAEAMNVSRSAVQQARKVDEQGTSELKESVVNGTVKVSDAAKIADKPPEVQRKAVKAKKEGKAKTVTKAAKEIEKEEAKEPDDEPWVDAWGIPITKEASKAFQNVEKFDELLKLLRQGKKLFKELAETEGGKFLQQSFVSNNTRDGFIHAGLDTCIKNVTDCKPKYTVCPYEYNKHLPHDKKNCKTCLGLGWVASIGKSSQPSEDIIKAAKKAHGVA